MVAVSVFVASAGISWLIGGVGTPAPNTLVAKATPVELIISTPDKTFYVVAFHWGWGVFSETGTKLGNITAIKGTIVKIIAVNAQAKKAIEKLPAPVADAINAVDWGDQSYKNGDPLLIWPYMQDHSLVVDMYSKVAYLDVNANEPQTIVFNADKAGEFQFACGNYCGYGHIDMPTTILFVEGD